jgi:diguanylate cyclase (GGDEF)-like protein
VSTETPPSQGTFTPAEQEAIEHRQVGDFLHAAQLFARAADEATDLQQQLNLQIRQAYCLVHAEFYDDAMALARVIAQQARSHGHLPELADVLSMIVDEHARCGRWAEAAEMLSEAVFILDQLANDSSNFQIVHNLADTYRTCGFVEAALELFDRALRIAHDDLDRQFSYASMSAAYHDAAQREPDPREQHRLLHDGLYAATAALDPEGGREVMAMCTALAHRSMMLAEIGHYHSALDDARKAKLLAGEHGMRAELLVALIGEALAVWGMTRDASVRELVDAALTLANELPPTEFLRPLHDLEVDVMWDLGAYTEARAALERNLHAAQQRLYDERAARWEHVLLGVEHLKVASAKQNDELTGLPNGAAFTSHLPDILEEYAPVCVGIIDLDGFHTINEQFGYSLGDGVLQEVAGLLERVCRRGDAVARLTGDEFAMVLRETSPGDARVVFERIRQLIASRTWHGLPPEVRITASVGVTVGAGSTEPTRMMADAHIALEQAKAAGRDRITIR